MTHLGHRIAVTLVATGVALAPILAPTVATAKETPAERVLHAQPITECEEHAKADVPCGLTIHPADDKTTTVEWTSRLVPSGGWRLWIDGAKNRDVPVDRDPTTSPDVYTVTVDRKADSIMSIVVQPLSDNGIQIGSFSWVSEAGREASIDPEAILLRCHLPLPLVNRWVGLMMVATALLIIG